MLLDPAAPGEARPGTLLPRSLFILAALAAGFLVARHAQPLPSLAWFAAAAGACAVAIPARGTPLKVVLFGAAACLAAGWFTLRLHEPPRGSILRHLPPGEWIITVEGVILDTPRPVEPSRDALTPRISGGPRTKARLALTSLHTDGGTIPVGGRLWITAGDRDAPTIRAGDRVRLTGAFSPVGPPMNPGEFDRRLWAAQSGYAGSLRVASLAGDLAAAEPGLLEQVHSAYLAARAAMNDRARELLLGPAQPAAAESATRAQGRALLSALILGEEEPALRDVRGAFNRLGLAHVLSISGFHMAVLAAVALLALRAMGDLGWLEPVLVAVLVLLYLAILPFNAPAWRSGLMVMGLLLGDALGRRYDRLAILGWIAILLLLWHPMDLWSIGFQLSFGLVAALIRLGDLAHGRLFGVRLRGTLVREPGPAGVIMDGFKRLASTNLLCCAVATPLVAYHTGLVSLLAAATGIVVVPIVTLVLIAGYAAVGLGILIPPLTPLAADAVGALASFTAWLVRSIDTIPGTSWRVPGVSLAWTLAATALAAYWFIRGRWRNRAAWAMTAAIALWAGAEFALGPRIAPDALRVDTLAVGDGSCHLIRRGRSAILWDCGSLSPGVGQLLVPRAVRALGAWRTPTLVITHPNIDHFSGVLDVAEPLGVREVVVGEAFIRSARLRPHGPEAYLIEQLEGRGIAVRTAAAGDTVVVGELELEILSPPRGADWTLENDMSLVAAVKDGRGGVLLMMTGDIQDRAMASTLAGRPGLHPRILEAPHHGSARPAAYEFVSTLNPAVVLQSTGPGRAGDPRWEAVRSRRAWRCTALEGAVWAEVGPDGLVRSGSWR